MTDLMLALGVRGGGVGGDFIPPRNEGTKPVLRMTERAQRVYDRASEVAGQSEAPND